MSPVAIGVDLEQGDAPPEVPWYRDARKLVIAGIVVCLVCLVILAVTDLQIPGLSPGSAAPSKVAYSFSPSPSLLAISVHPPADHLVAGKMVPMEVLFSNSTTQSIEVHTSWTAPCFSLQPSQPEVISVPASNSFLLDFDVTPLCDTGFQGLTLYFWTSTSGVPYKSVASIAPIQITAEWEHKLYRFFFLFSALLRALAIPAVLAGLAFWFQRRSADRDRHYKDEQDRRDQRLKDAQDARDRRESILTTRIPEYSKIVQEHYLPISRRGDTIESEMLPVLKSTDKLTEAELKEKVKAALAAQTNDKSNELWRMLAAIMLYRARMLALFTSKGGIYFRSNQAERLYASLVNEFFARIYLRVGKEDFNESVALLDPEDKLSTALHRCLTGKGRMPQGAAAVQQTDEETNDNLARLKRIFDGFKQWILDAPAEFRAYTRLIQLSSRVLDFECDRPFFQTAPFDPLNPEKLEESGWYFDPPMLAFRNEMYDIPANLRTDLDAEIRFYIDHVPPKCKVVEFEPFPR